MKKLLILLFITCVPQSFGTINEINEESYDWYWKKREKEYYNLAVSQVPKNLNFFYEELVRLGMLIKHQYTHDLKDLDNNWNFSWELTPWLNSNEMDEVDHLITLFNSLQSYIPMYSKAKRKGPWITLPVGERLCIEIPLKKGYFNTVKKHLKKMINLGAKSKRQIKKGVRR